MSKRKIIDLVDDDDDDIYFQPPRRQPLKSRIAPSSNPRRECTICTDTLRSSAFPAKIHDSNGHANTICSKCWETFLESEVRDTSKSTGNIRCPDCRSALVETEIRRLATPAVYDQYLEKSTQEFLRQDPHYRSCPAENCSYGYILTQDDLESGAIFNCRVCDVKYCTRCEVNMHTGETCEQYTARQEEDRSEKLSQERASERLLATTTKCPGCSVPIEKNGGCPHMSCTSCKHEFCWTCKARWTQGHSMNCQNAQVATPLPVQPQLLPLLPAPAPSHRGSIRPPVRTRSVRRVDGMLPPRGRVPRAPRRRTTNQ